MNIFKKLLSIDRTLANQPDNSHNKIFRHLSMLLATADNKLDHEILFENFIEREKLGSTYIGHGIAIPHIRSSQVNKAYGALLQLEHGMKFSSSTEENTDLFLGFIVPKIDNEQHLKILANLSEKFSNNNFRESLRSAKDSLKLYNLATK